MALSILTAILIIPKVVAAQSVDSAGSISDLIQTTGGWGLSSLLIIAIVVVVRDNLQQRDKLLELHTTQHKALFEMLEKKIQTDVLHEQSFRELRVMIEKWLDRSSS